MKGKITLMLALIVLLGTISIEAKTTSGSSFTASSLIVKKGRYLEFSSRSQSNLKNAGFTLTYTRNTQFHDVDDDYNDVVVTGVQKLYSRGGIMVSLFYYKNDQTVPVFIEIDFPTQASRDGFLRTLPRLGFSNNDGGYIAMGTGMVVDTEGNHVSISYML